MTLAARAVPGAGAALQLDQLHAQDERSRRTRRSSRRRSGLLICPSEVKPQPYTSTNAAGVTSTLRRSRTTAGTWATGTSSAGRPAMAEPGRLRVNLSQTFAAFTDGLSKTMLAAEVKAYQPAYHDCPGRRSPANRASPIGRPRPDARCSRPSASASLGVQDRPRRATPSGATGTRFYDGFTTALTPNTQVPRGLARRRLRPRAPRTRTTAARPTRRSRRGATTPAASTPCSATAASGSSRTRSSGRPGAPGHGRRRRDRQLRRILNMLTAAMRPIGGWSEDRGRCRSAPVASAARSRRPRRWARWRSGRGSRRRAG